MKTVADHIRAYAPEAQKFIKSAEAREAERALHAFHPAIPGFVDESSKFLEAANINIADSPSTSRRLADAILAEIIAAGGQIPEHQQRALTGDILRNVLTQEAAGHEYLMRNNRDFLRDAENDHRYENGANAMKILENAKVDVTRVFASLDDDDLHKAAAGGYNMMTLAGRTLIAESLGTVRNAGMATTKVSLEADQPQEAMARPRPLMNAARRHERPMPTLLQGRQPTFGRRVAAQAAMARGGIAA